MELHKDSGSLRVIIDVSYTSADEFIDFIENDNVSWTLSLQGRIESFNWWKSGIWPVG